MSRIIDLSLPIKPGMRGVQIDVARRLERDGWNATTLSLYSHAGTHMDAPRHFLPDAATLDQQSLDVCVGPAIVVNLSHVSPRSLIAPQHLSAVDEQVQPGCRLLLRTDWHHHAEMNDYRTHFPRISAELAVWFVEHGVALIGVEPPSVADVYNMQELTRVHEILLGAGIVIVEGLAHLDQLTQPIVQFIALPLRVIGGDGCPVRAVAIED